MSISIARPSQASPLAAGPWLVVALAGFVVLLFFEDIAALWSAWSTSATYSHGFLVALLIPWLAWRRRDWLVVDARSPWPAVVPALCAAAVVWVMASAAQIDILRQALLPPIAWLTVLGILGASAARALLLPLAWMYCAIPLWDAVIGPLQRITAAVDWALLGVLGIPASLEGIRVTVPAGVFEVSDGCSGLNFFVTAVTLSVACGHIWNWNYRRRAVLVGLAIAVAMVSNWIRVLIIIVAGEMTDMQTPLVEDHYTFGWWLFAAAIVVFLALALRHDVDRGVVTPSLPFVAAFSRSTGVIPALLVMAAAALGPVWAAALGRAAEAAENDSHSIQLPEGGQRWRGPLPSAAEWQPVQPGARRIARGSYYRGDVELLVHTADYGRQRQGAELIGFSTRMAGPEGWRALSDVPFDTGAAIASGRVRELQAVDAADQRWLVWYWYQMDGYLIADPAVVKLRQALRAFSFESGAAMVALAIRCPDRCEGQRPLLVEFLDAHGVDLRSGVPSRQSASEPEASR